MTLLCPHCSRANSVEARFCYFDGAALLGSSLPIETARKTFLAPFVFPSGVTCDNYDEFVSGCQRHWDDAVRLLHAGHLGTFFSGLGRLDLACAADEAAAFPDRDRGLDLFLARLPTTAIVLPRLDVQPKLINLGTLRVGQNAQIELSLENHGKRLVFGSIVANVPWLALTPGIDGHDSKLFQFRERTTITVHVRGQHLRAAVKPLEGNLILESNAGAFRLKVIASVPITPFPDGVLTGARTPRDIAEKAKDAPRQAAASFESGAVARWYQTNGWTYPVQGTPTSGIAAVQQFFEALGISKPPKVSLSVPSLHLKAAPGTRLACKIEVRTSENRAVYAHAVSPAPWLVVKPAVLLGTSAALPFEITTPASAGETLTTTLRIFANGQQRFDVPVEVTTPAPAAVLDVRPPEKAPILPSPAVPVAPVSLAPSFVPDASPTPVVQPRSFEPLKILTHVAPLVLLVGLVGGLVLMDGFTAAPQQVAQIDDEPQEERPPLKGADVEFKVAIQDEPDIDVPVIPVVRFKIDDEPEERFAKLPPPPVTVDIKDEAGENNPARVDTPIAAAPLVGYAYNTTPRTFGISSTGAAGKSAFKKLTYERNGFTNSTMVSVNGARAEFGGAQGVWLRKNLPLDNVAPTPGAVQPSHSTWAWNGITIHQILEVVPGQAATTDGVSRRQLDTVLVRWIMQNNAGSARTAGMRLQLDTLIGGNDGVPFTVPGRTGLVSTSADFPVARDVPDFIQALERSSLRDPGTVAHLTIKPGGGIEPASRVSLTHWPGDGFGGRTPVWDVAVAPMRSDSAIVLYWPEKMLKQGDARLIGFAYGLGSVSITDKLGVTLGGSFEPGENFTVSAYVENPIAGQTLKLELPDGLRRQEGAETQNVASPAAGGRNTSIVTWKVRVERTGEFRLKVSSSTGLSQAKTIVIGRAAAPTGGKLRLDVQGAFEPGQSFTLRAIVNEPLDGQGLTLNVPAGLEKIAGDLLQRVPAPAPGTKDAVVEWKLKVLEPGKYPLRVASSTGIAQTKTVTIVRPGRAEGAFQILLTGDFAPGKEFTVSTRVNDPAPDQKLSLVLPEGLERAAGDETRVAAAGALISWKVKVSRPGKYLVGVKSTTGVTQRKTVVIESPSADGRFTLDFAGDIRPGREFTIKADVTKPRPGQTLTLVLPKELQLADGDVTQSVSAGESAAIAWKVRVLESGRLPVRVESSTGLTRTKTITLTESTKTLFGR